MDDLKHCWVKLKKRDKQALAERLETSVAYLSQLAHGHRNPSKRMRRDIERELVRIDRNSGDLAA